MSCDVQDLFVIDHDTFLRLRPGSSGPSGPSGVHAKIEEILKLDCFNENSPRMLQATFQQKPHPRNGPGGGGHGHRSFGGGGGGHRYGNPPGNHHPGSMLKPPRARSDLTAKDKLMREIQSNINKIAESNRVVIFKKIEKLIDLRNVDEIVNILLENCSTNGSYITSMMELVKNVAVTYPTEVEKCISVYISNFSTHFEQMIQDFTKLHYEDYNQFCTFLKNKIEISNRLKIVITFLKTYQDVMSTDIFFEKILNLVSAQSIQGHSHVQDMMIEMVGIFFDLADITDGIYNTFCEHSIELAQHVSKKSKFAIEDILAKHKRVKVVPKWCSSRIRAALKDR